MRFWRKLRDFIVFGAYPGQFVVPGPVTGPGGPGEPSPTPGPPGAGQPGSPPTIGGTGPGPQPGPPPPPPPPPTPTIPGPQPGPPFIVPPPSGPPSPPEVPAPGRPGPGFSTPPIGPGPQATGGGGGVITYPGQPQQFAPPPISRVPQQQPPTPIGLQPPPLVIPPVAPPVAIPPIAISPVPNFGPPPSSLIPPIEPGNPTFPSPSFLVPGTSPRTQCGADEYRDPLGNCQRRILPPVLSPPSFLTPGEQIPQPFREIARTISPEREIQRLGRVIVGGVQRLITAPVTLGTQIGSIISPPPSYLQYIQQQRPPTEEVLPTTFQPGTVSEPPPVFGTQFCPDCVPGLRNQLRNQCPDCTPQDLARIVSQCGTECTPESVLLRAQQEQTRKSIRTERQQETRSEIQQQQRQLEGYRQEERAIQTGQTGTSPTDIQRQIEEKQALLEQIGQELQEIESQQASNQLPNVPPDNTQLAQRAGPPQFGNSYQNQGYQPTASSSGSSRETGIFTAQPPPTPAPQPVVFCVGCQSQNDAFRFLNGEPSQCSVIPNTGDAYGLRG